MILGVFNVPSLTFAFANFKELITYFSTQTVQKICITIFNNLPSDVHDIF